ncbi:MAG: aspartyl-tRNA(Asn)/glutamyl-tRNA(Gln) amidotransferase subunit [Actinomycetota bacterium]|jgi:aspartyl-tRNA(Asn)/glutamyl-tRNA(Gln) amidotransferase subunit C|nr:aspartyl-tRNA(Asn)/glutamyl-tRNA(Gln) amidotransferase subunit [Actinomycetota bacterium]
MTSSASITRAEVAHLANLARLALTDEELDHFGDQLAVIIGAVSRIGDLETADVPPTSHALPLTNVVREDVVRPGLTQEQALAGAPAAEDGRFRVPRILGEEA